MRPRPEHASIRGRRRERSRCLAAGLATALAFLPVAPALGQGGPGAERYEVTITPPKRPGSQAGVVDDSPPSATPRAGSADTGLPTTDHVLGATEPGAAASGAGRSRETGAGAGSRDVAAKAAPIPDPNLPRRSLQVGAFRQRSLATAMQDKLEGGFPDVEVVEVQSGGTPLFRVNVGRLPKGPALSALKNRLADAGYPSFDVPAPSPAAD